jgi:hypothetical protein
MNIFALDQCFEKSARLQNNKHSYRMPLESMGMLMFAFPDGAAPYSNSHKHRHYFHPASKWARETRENFEWLLNHFEVQLDEYKIRYKRNHDSGQYLDWIKANYRSISFSNSGLTPFARCFSSFKEQLEREEPDTVKAYQKFYILDKIDFAKWPSIEKIPCFWPEKSVKFVDKNFLNGQYTKR